MVECENKEQSQSSRVNDTKTRTSSGSLPVINTRKMTGSAKLEFEDTLTSNSFTVNEETGDKKPFLNYIYDPK